MRNILCQSRSEVKMAGESAHSRPESSSSAEEREDRELPHVREGWEEREGEREQEEGEGESRRDQGRFGYLLSNQGRFGNLLSFCLSVPCGLFCQQLCYAESTFRILSDGLMLNQAMPAIDIIIPHSHRWKAKAQIGFI